MSELKIEEIIFDAGVAAGETNRNKRNSYEGAKHILDGPTLDKHKNHIPFAVKGS